MDHGAQHSATCVEQAEETVKELRAALATAGITLPSLGIDPASLAREVPRPLVELGRCSVETAARLAAVLG
ncbi:hypothetical protein [Streptomyces sp. NBC_00878]|uniref:hypothetical protein n=1 Tax=Streptomyces sp. NBC_00878 TaxID=2975854 RepID=UPI00225B1ADF|nr:hypothetical protein [Streptomyces sp. NBC_00878]MCX4908807.1 hypothetical protein [Streptomyces sp. NBC_00878]